MAGLASSGKAAPLVHICGKSKLVSNNVVTIETM